MKRKHETDSSSSKKMRTDSPNVGRVGVNINEECHYL
jgi:hypothetical protein